ncbi:hypothetical protein CRUP_002117, partial [Coryphaenoides rupestris]
AGALQGALHRPPVHRGGGEERHRRGGNLSHLRGRYGHSGPQSGVRYHALRPCSQGELYDASAALSARPQPHHLPQSAGTPQEVPTRELHGELHLDL